MCEAAQILILAAKIHKLFEWRYWDAENALFIPKLLKIARVRGECQISRFGAEK